MVPWAGPLRMATVSSLVSCSWLEASSVGELLLLRDPWLRVASTASGRFAREIETRAFPSGTGQFLCIHTVDTGEHTRHSLLKLLLFFPNLVDLVQYLQSLGWGDLATNRLVGFFESASGHSMAGA
jgi:hypothetical protein